MAWKETDEKLIRRGELILDPSLLESHEKELKTMNRGRRGRPYLLANTYVELLSSIRYLYQMPYRQLEGFTRSLHTTRPRSAEWNVRFPMMIKGDTKYKPADWPEDYNVINHDLTKLFNDLEKGKVAVLAGLDLLKPADLDASIDLGHGPRKRIDMLTTYLLGAVQHSGQIAMLKGNISRRREKEPNFLK
jgi:hypothetical protein